MVLTHGGFASQGTSAMFGDISGCHRWEENAPSLWWVEAKDADEPPTMDRTTWKNKESAGP